MTDKELLTLAARAAGIEYGEDRTDYGLSLTGKDGRHIHFPKWNPLTDPGDALRLAVQLDMHVTLAVKVGQVFTCASGGEWICLPLGTDPLAATMRAIVRAAAEIGRRMPG